MRIIPGRISSLLLLIALSSGSVAFSQNAPLAIGDRAPDFSLPCATKDSIWSADVPLASFLGAKYVVLAFYPANWSSGCTKEVCMFRDNFDLLSTLNAQVLAISGDYVYSHHEWAKQLSLPFILLSDHSHAVAKAYQSYNPTSGFNRRTIFVIDGDGIIRYIDYEYRVRDNTSFDRLREALTNIDGKQ